MRFALTAAGYTVRPITGKDEHGNPWLYEVTGQRGVKWYVRRQVANGPRPFLCACRSLGAKPWERTSIGKFFRLEEDSGVLYGMV